MAAWLSDYFKWLTTSKIGLGEAAAANNHGTFYDVQAVAVALSLGETNSAKQILLQAETNRIASQIEPDGRMPRELARTLSFDYSEFNLRALIELAGLGEKAGVDLWHYQSLDGRSILKAAEFMAQFADPKREWPYKQIHAPNRGELGELLSRAAAEFPQEVQLKEALKYLIGAGSKTRVSVALSDSITRELNLFLNHHPFRTVQCNRQGEFIPKLAPVFLPPQIANGMFAGNLQVAPFHRHRNGGICAGV